MEDLFATKKERCRHSYMDLVNANTLVYRCKTQDYKEVCDNDCDNCAKYDSRFIEYPITVNSLETEAIDYTDCLYKSYIGKPVAVRVCENNKTYIGLFLGELPIHVQTSYNNKSGELNIRHHFNPAMFVPELNRIVFGNESWWRIIESESQFSEITDVDIENTWYVKILKSFGNN